MTIQRILPMLLLGALSTASIDALKNKRWNYVRANQANILGQLKTAGSMFVGGNLDVFGDQLVEGNVIILGNKTIIGNLLVEGVITNTTRSGISSVTITGDTGGPLIGNSFVFTGGTTGLTFNGSGGDTETLAGTLVVDNGGTRATTLTGVLIGNGTSAVTGNPITQFDVLVGGASNAINSVAPGATGIPLVSNGVAANPIFGTATVPGGGTGQITLAANQLLAGNGTLAIQSVSNGTAGQVLTSNGAGVLPSFQAASATIAITGDTGGPLTSNSFVFTGGTTGLTFNGAGTTETLGGTLAVANGGTGATTLTGVLIGHGTSAVTGNPITQFDVLVGGASNAINSVAPGATGIPLISNGAAANPIFGTATVPGGGTGAISFTAYAVLTGGTTSTNPIQSIASVGTAGQVLTSNGAGALPTFQAPAPPTTLTLNGDTGSASGTTITVRTGQSTRHSGSSVSFSGSGSTLTFNVTDGNDNTLIGLSAGGTAVTGTDNTGVGGSALTSLTSGISNCAFGQGALLLVTTGSRNSGVGETSTRFTTTSSDNSGFGWESVFQSAAPGNSGFGSSALQPLVAGVNNCALGFDAGAVYASTQSNNIVIGASTVGSGSDNKVIRIGVNDGSILQCFIQGIFGVTTGGVGVPVLIDATGHLGTVLSSRRYKNSIVDMDDQSASILALRPVTFCYNSDAHNRRQYGLVAEEVAEIMPDMVIYNNDGEPETVRYHDLPVMILNELQKHHDAVQKLVHRIDALEGCC